MKNYSKKIDNLKLSLKHLRYNLMISNQSNAKLKINPEIVQLIK